MYDSAFFSFSPVESLVCTVPMDVLGIGRLIAFVIE